MTAGAEAEAASLGFDSLLAPLLAIAAAAVILTSPITVLAGTFAVLGAGLVGIAALTGQVDDYLKLLTDHLGQMASALGERAAPAAAMLLYWLDGFIPVIQRFGEQLIDWFVDRLPTMLPIVTQIVQVAIAAVVGFAQAWGHLVDWFMAHWEQYSTAIGSVFSAIGTGIHFALPLLGLVQGAFEALGPVIQFVRDHADSLKPILYALGALFVGLAASIALGVAFLVAVTAAVVAVASAISFAIAHVQALADAFLRVVGAAQAAANAIGRTRDAVASIPGIGGALHIAGIPGFQEGGVVPGAIGAPMLAMVHGGETITPPGRGTVVNYNLTVNAPVGSDPHAIGSQIVEYIQQYERRGGASWRGSSGVGR